MKGLVYSKRYLQAKKREKNMKKKTIKRRPLAFSAIVLGKRNIEPKQPNSGLRKCIKIQTKKDKKVLYAFCPGDGAIEFIEEHDEVMIVGVGTKKGRPKGDIPAVSWMVSKVNGICLNSLLNCKREKKLR
jgi:small subunit ribosomal protein S12